MLNELAKLSALSNNHITKLPHPTLTACEFSRATATMLGFPTPTLNESNVPSVAAAITPDTPHPNNASTPTSVEPN
jgi:hypothetical protein